MNIFQLTFSSLNAATIEMVLAQLEQTFGRENTFSAGGGVFFVAHAFIQLPKELALSLGENVTTGTLGNFVVIPVSAYWGFHNQSLWSWLAAKGL